RNHTISINSDQERRAEGAGAQARIIEANPGPGRRRHATHPPDRLSAFRPAVAGGTEMHDHNYRAQFRAVPQDRELRRRRR
ncbi:hypothetical protein, partial [Micromonospora aurantiaca]|uniref:hypothetical protein n=1 Tax=Micromonospora aurantiaca (nom. illeg.) TaxID=47850 RepID=UPI00197C31E3